MNEFIARPEHCSLLCVPPSVISTSLTHPPLFIQSLTPNLFLPIICQTRHLCPTPMAIYLSLFFSWIMATASSLVSLPSKVLIWSWHFPYSGTAHGFPTTKKEVCASQTTVWDMSNLCTLQCSSPPPSFLYTLKASSPIFISQILYGPWTTGSNTTFFRKLPDLQTRSNSFPKSIEKLSVSSVIQDLQEPRVGW